MSKVKDFMSNNLMQIAATFSGNYTPPILTDEYTQKVFKENSSISVSINFRLYYDSPDNTSNPIDTFKWMSCTMFPISHWDLLNAMNATISAANLAMDVGSDAGKKFQSIKTSLDTTTEDKNVKEKKSAIDTIKDVTLDLESELLKLSRNNYGGYFYNVIFGNIFNFHVYIDKMGFKISKETVYYNDKIVPYYIDFDLSLNLITKPSMDIFNTYMDKLKTNGNY